LDWKLYRSRFTTARGATRSTVFAVAHCHCQRILGKVETVGILPPFRGTGA
jgi:hypothetical protein